jgi:hypothetical protein
MEVVHHLLGRIFGALAENLFPVAAWVRMRSMLRERKNGKRFIGAIGHGLERHSRTAVSKTPDEGLEDFASGGIRDRIATGGCELSNSSCGENRFDGRIRIPWKAELGEVVLNRLGDRHRVSASVSMASGDIGESEKIVGERLQIFVDSFEDLFLEASTFVSRLVFFFSACPVMAAWSRCATVMLFRSGRMGAMGSSNGTPLAPTTRQLAADMMSQMAMVSSTVDGRNRRGVVDFALEHAQEGSVGRGSISLVSVGREVSVDSVMVDEESEGFE